MVEPSRSTIREQDGHASGEVRSKGPCCATCRTPYGRGIDNRFMAGRNTRVTHEAPTDVRVVNIRGMMDEIVGGAASLCPLREAMTREIYSQHLDDLKQLTGERITPALR